MVNLDVSSLKMFRGLAASGWSVWKKHIYCKLIPLFHWCDSLAPFVFAIPCSLTYSDTLTLNKAVRHLGSHNHVLLALHARLSLNLSPALLTVPRSLGFVSFAACDSCAQLIRIHTQTQTRLCKHGHKNTSPDPFDRLVFHAHSCAPNLARICLAFDANALFTS